MEIKYIGEARRRFLVFRVYDYEYGCGIHDAFRSFDTIEEALAFTVEHKKSSFANIQIFDCKVGKQVKIEEMVK